MAPTLGGQSSGIDLATLLVATGLILPASSGCLATEEGTAEVPVPGVGSVYRYENGTDGFLELQIGGTGDRLGPHGTVGEARLLDVAVGNDTRMDAFQEGLDEDGSIWQQVAACRTPTSEQPCENAMTILTTAGLPGGLGSAPFWGQPLDNLTTEPHRFEVPGYGPGMIAYNVSPAPEMGEGCRQLEGGLERPNLTRAPTYAVVNGPFTLCPGTALPVRFHATGGSVFTLETANRTKGDASLPSPRSGSHDRAPDPTSPWEEPYLAQDFTHEFPFPLREAHHEALNRSDIYRNVIEDGGWVVGTLVQERGYGEYMGQRYQGLFERRLIAATPEGDAAEVLLSKRVTAGQAREQVVPEPGDQLMGTPEGIVQLEEESKGKKDPSMTPSSVADRQVDVGKALETARSLLGDRNVSHIQLLSTFLPHQWSNGWPGIGPDRPDGTTLRLLLEGATRTQGGFLIRTNYQFVVDGPSGDLLWLTLPREDLPLDEAPGS